MGKQSRIKELRRDVAESARRLVAEGQAAGNRMAVLGFDAPPECMYPQLQPLFSALYALTVATWVDALDTSKDEGSVRAAAKAVMVHYGRFEKHAYAMFEMDQEAKPDCKVGCHWCCFVRVTIPPHEALALQGAIEAMPEEQRTRTRQRLSALSKEIADTPAESLIRLRRLCPLNEEGKCTVYDSRPLVCRTTHSYSVFVCREYAEKGNVYPGRVNGIVMEFGRAVALANVAAMKHFGLDSRSYDLASIVTAMADDGKLASAFLAGDASKLDPLFRGDAAALVEQDLMRMAEGELPG